MEPAPEPRKRPRVERTVAITGVTSRLGPELLAFFVRLGLYAVHGCGGDAAAVARLREAHPDAVLSVVDVADDGAVAAWVETCGAVEVVVCNAARAPALPPPPEEYRYERRDRPWELAAAAVDGVVDGNVRGLANVLRRGVAALARRGAVGVDGTFVAVTAGAGLCGDDAANAPCAAAEAAVDVLVAATARYLPPPLVAARLASGLLPGDLRGDDAAAILRRWADRCGMMVLALDRGDNGAALSIPPGS
jgi:NAD(P)-dependent dehydrogenase (short-subunit alcohol dehydrogenase family)